MAASHSAPLVLGTAQLGMPYGIANRTGMPSAPAARLLVARALELGVRRFDTARAYGESEARLGLALWGHPEAHIVTKLAPLDNLPEDAAPADIAAATRSSIARSADALCRGRLDRVLLHRTRHLHSHGGHILATLLALQGDGRITVLGASVQSPAELRLALSFRAIRHVQLPCNILDWRWREPALLARLADRPDVTVDLRSVLLQGLLACPHAAPWPVVPGLKTQALPGTLGALAETLGRESVADLCFAYVRGLPFVSGVVVGAETQEQLAANAALFARPPLDPDERRFAERFLPAVPEMLLNPARWPAREAA